MFILEIGFHAAVRRTFYADKTRAEAELAALLPKLGRSAFHNDDEDWTHTVKSDCGDLVVVCERVEAAAIVDSTAHQVFEDEAESRRIELARRAKTALGDTGMKDSIT